MLKMHFIFCILIYQMSVLGRLKVLDNKYVDDVLDLSQLTVNSFIALEKEREMDYRQTVQVWMKTCSQHVTFKSDDVSFRYKECSDPTGKHFKVIPALNEADLHEIASYRRGNEMKMMKPFAPHLIVLEDVAFYGHGDIMSLDGTSHHLGVCRLFGAATGSDTIDIKRKDMIFFDKPVVNLVTLWTENYFYALCAYLPRMLSLLPLLENYPSISVLKNTPPQTSKTETFLSPILDYYRIMPNKWYYDYDGSPKMITFTNFEYGKVHFAKYLISPISSCKFIPRQFVKMIRAAVHDMYQINVTRDLTTIVVSDRPELDALHAKLEQLYGDKTQVVKYNLLTSLSSPSISLRHTVSVFSSCRIFISLNGAGLANIMFMSKGASVIVVKTEELPTWHYAYLSSTVGVNFYWLPKSKKRQDTLSTVEGIMSGTTAVLLLNSSSSLRVTSAPSTVATITSTSKMSSAGAPLTMAHTRAPLTLAPTRAQSAAASTRSPSTVVSTRASSTMASTRAPSTMAPTRAPSTAVPTAEPSIFPPTFVPSTTPPSVAPSTTSPTYSPSTPPPSSTPIYATTKKTSFFAGALSNYLMSYRGSKNNKT